MLYLYIFVSAALLPILDSLGVPVFKQSHSWWSAPLLMLGFILLFVLLQFIVLAISLCIVNLKGNPNRGTKFYRFLINAALPMLWKIGRVHIHITGTEKVPENGRFMLVCNHNHDIDPAVILTALPASELGFIAKKEIYTTPKFWLVARAMHKLNCIPIDRENNRNAAETIVRAIKLIKDGAVSIGVFPEGYTSLDGRLHEFRNGVFKIACKAECPIVVCTLVGTRAAAKRLIRKRSDIYFDVADVLQPEEIAEMNTAQISERAHTAMEQSLEKRGATVQEI